MGRRKRLRKLGWRWRRNPLRRRTDLIEACLGLVTATLLCTVPLVGWWAGHSVDRTLQRVMRTQRAERTLVTAEVAPVVKPAASATASAASAPAAEDSSTASVSAVSLSGLSDARGGDMLRWTAPDHSVHTAAVPVGIEVWRDGKVLVWTDHRGKLVPPPLDTATATTHSVLAGVAAATSVGGLLLISHKVLAWRLMRRRLDSWERDWARVGQDWGRAGADG